MATATQIAEKALKRLGLIQAGASPSAVDTADATDALNTMIGSWVAEGITGADVPLDSRFEHAIIALLAVRLAEDYGVQPGPILLSDAKNGWTAIVAAHFVVPKSTFETSISSTGPDWSNQYILGDTMNYADWQADTDYELRTFAVNGANLYECTTSGTSASSGGPTGTASEITDGTVVWCWRRVTS